MITTGPVMMGEQDSQLFLTFIATFSHYIYHEYQPFDLDVASTTVHHGPPFCRYHFLHHPRFAAEASRSMEPLQRHGEINGSSCAVCSAVAVAKRFVCSVDSLILYMHVCMHPSNDIGIGKYLQYLQVHIFVP